MKNLLNTTNTTKDTSFNKTIRSSAEFRASVSSPSKNTKSTTKERKSPNKFEKEKIESNKTSRIRKEIHYIS